MTRRIFCRVLLVVVAVFGLLALSGVLLAQGNRDWVFEHVKYVQEANTARLMAMDGVEGTAIGLNENGRLAIKVFTAGPGVAGIPRNIDGVPVEVVVTGKFYALPKPEKPPGKPDKPPKPEPDETVDPTSRFERPVPIGVSTGNVESNSAGTIACKVTKGDAVYALSNNHVYALENTASENSAVLQPGRYDGGTAEDAIGTLAEYVEIDFEGGDNVVDAAIALCYAGALGNATPSDGYGIPNSDTVTASVGLAVQKYDRTTGLTKGTVSGIGATVNVSYSSGTARFVGQIIVEARKPVIKAGDSGSLLVTDPDKYPVGLLFAGNGNGKLAVANPIDLVLEAFEVSIDGE